MNKTSPATRFLVALSGSLLVVGATWMVRHPSDATRADSSRAPASNRFDTAKKRRLDEHQEAPATGKITAAFRISIVGMDSNGLSLSELSETAEQVHLKATITADQHVAPHEFNWIFPDTYRVLGGNPKGMTPELHPGDSFDVSLVLHRGQEPVQPIVLHVFKIVNSEPRGQVAQFDIPVPGARKPSENPPNGLGRGSEHKYVQ